MYESFFGLHRNPFVMTPDPALLFLTASHREALAGLNYAILSRKGFVVLTGEAGTGKTTLLTAVLQSMPSTRAQFSLILNPTLTPAEFLEMALLDFGLSDIPVSKAQRLLRLQQFLIETHRQGRVAVLIVDEAHKLGPDLLEEIRLLTNFETAQGKLLQIVLAGQSELGELLNRDDLRQLKQRVAVRLSIQPLSPPEVERYIRHRWAKAGAVIEPPFRADAISRITAWSRGVPRVVNAICDNALLLAFGENQATIAAHHILEVVADLDLLGGTNGYGKPVAAAPLAPSAPPQPLTAAQPFDLPPLRTLERYLPASHKVSLWWRLAGKLGFVQ